MMNRKVLFISIIAIMFYSCGNNIDKNKISKKEVYKSNKENFPSKKNALPKFKFDKEIYDFGKLIQGEQVSYGFKFKNVGGSDLIISKVGTSCGCTVPTFPKKSIHPGEEAVVNVKFNTEGRIGFQNKTITVVSNTESKIKFLRIKAAIYKMKKN